MSDSHNCIFCKILDGEIPSNKVYEDDRVLAFHDIAPNAPVHVLVIPKEHIPSLNFVDESNNVLIAHIVALIPKLARGLGVSESGYRVVINCGEDSGMAVEHLHFHILGGRHLPQKLG
ncbi:MAG: histidine triad nucleotide-binding protein [Clostridiales bacterium]|nr:histidine triad nucleotide-binding protein [Clostridiales bacterium]